MTGSNFQIDDLIDERYSLLELLGEGGTGTVYRARELGLERFVALKFLQSTQLSDPSVRTRFEREAAVLSSLRHPNIVQFYRMGVLNNNNPYIAMELVEGRSLRALINDAGQIHPDAAISIGLQLCDAMESAHQCGVLHRDLKPDNILMLNPDQRTLHAKIVDFGLARFEPGNPGRVTQTGAVVGSLHYLSPEQCKGSIVDARSDVYSLGCTLFELITGKTVFAADNPIELISKHVTEAPPAISQVAPRISLRPGLEAVLLKSISQNPDERYQSMREFGKELMLVKTQRADELTAKLPEQSNRRRKFWLAIGAVILSGVTAISFLSLNRQSESDQDELFRTPSRTRSRRSIATDLQDARELSRLNETNQGQLLKRLNEAEQLMTNQAERLKDLKPPNYLAFQVFYQRGIVRQRQAFLTEDSAIGAKSIADFIKATAMATTESGARFRYAANSLGALGTTYEHFKDFQNAKTNFNLALETLADGLPAEAEHGLPLPRDTDDRRLKTRLMQIQLLQGNPPDKQAVRAHIERYLARKNAISADVMEAATVLFSLYENDKKAQRSLLDHITESIKENPANSRSAMADIHASLADLYLRAGYSTDALAHLVESTSFYEQSSRESTATTRHILALIKNLSLTFPTGSENRTIEKCRQEIEANTQRKFLRK